MCVCARLLTLDASLGSFDAIWPIFTGNCHLARPSSEFLDAAGEWERVELRRMGDEIPWLMFPRVYGTMVKAR